MDINDEGPGLSILTLPDEVTVMILMNNDPADIVNFGATCKRFHNLIQNHNYLWKNKYVVVLPPKMTKALEENNQYIDWLLVLKDFYRLKRELLDNLIAMPAKYYWRSNEIQLQDLKCFFEIASSSPVAYYYTTYILQDLIEKIEKLTDSETCVKPKYTMTILYYAKNILRNLMQIYLVVKFVHMRVTKKSTRPEFVINFFLQWIDSTKMYYEQDIKVKIDSVAKQVADYLTHLDSQKSSNNSNPHKKHTHRQILYAISHVIYRSAPIVISPITKTSTLNIIKVIEEKQGCVIAYGVIYQGVARKFGINCELIAFTNHLFLQWRSSEDDQLYTVDLVNGDLKPKRKCPFSQSSDPNGRGTEGAYCPIALLKFVCSAYLQSKRRMRDWRAQDIERLVTFLRPLQVDYPYGMLIHFLNENRSLQYVENTDIHYMNPVCLQAILRLSSSRDDQDPAIRKETVKHHESHVSYAVGMICYHTVYNYVCVIRGWEMDGKYWRLPYTNEKICLDQPFYCVVTSDETERYVAQEHLKLVTYPFRMHNVEEYIYKDFTHFDGFSYVPTDEKSWEYPDDAYVIGMFKNFHSTIRNML